jgi:2-dehydro-3-deoxyphosphogalactonate aldolase
MTLDEALTEVAIVAIIRGVRPEEAVDIGAALHEGGVRVVEVPLNSPDPLQSIEALAKRFGDQLVLGAGTVLTPERVQAVADAGGRIIVTPNTNPAVIERAVALGLDPMPGFATASEAFTAHAAGARRLKLFPASTYGATHVKALKAVLPKDATVFAVGGVGPAAMAEWKAAGADGFGLGSELYKPGQSPEDTVRKARAAVEAFRNAYGARSAGPITAP